jgi:hypothetical protein
MSLGLRCKILFFCWNKWNEMKMKWNENEIRMVLANYFQSEGSAQQNFEYIYKLSKSIEKTYNFFDSQHIFAQKHTQIQIPTFKKLNFRVFHSHLLNLAQNRNMEPTASTRGYWYVFICLIWWIFYSVFHSE